MRSSKIKAFNARYTNLHISGTVVTNISSNNNERPPIKLFFFNKTFSGFFFSLPDWLKSYFTYIYDSENPVNNPIKYRIRVRTDKINDQFTDEIVVTPYYSSQNEFYLAFDKITENIAKDIEYAATELNKEYGGNYSDISKEKNVYIINAFNLYDDLYNIETKRYKLLLEY